jgi:hypothetical protein
MIGENMDLFKPPLLAPTEDGQDYGILDYISSISTTSGRWLTVIFCNQHR